MKVNSQVSRGLWDRCHKLIQSRISSVQNIRVFLSPVQVCEETCGLIGTQEGLRVWHRLRTQSQVTYGPVLCSPSWCAYCFWPTEWNISGHWCLWQAVGVLQNYFCPRGGEAGTHQRPLISNSTVEPLWRRPQLRAENNKLHRIVHLNLTQAQAP